MPNNLLKRCPRILIPGDDRWIQYYHPNGGDNIVIDLRGPSFVQSEMDGLISELILRRCVNSGLQLLTVAYNESFTNVGGELSVSISGNTPELISSNEFLSRHIPTSGSTTKSINRSSASSYHDWQRRYFGTNISIPDIDAFLVNQLDPLSDFRIIEIKRSFFSPRDWLYKNYFGRQDSPNFVALADFADRTGISGVSIMYVKNKESKYDTPGCTENTEFGYFPIQSAHRNNVIISEPNTIYGQLEDVARW
jgi:hypothetical protein